MVNPWSLPVSTSDLPDGSLLPRLRTDRHWSCPSPTGCEIMTRESARPLPQSLTLSLALQQANTVYPSLAYPFNRSGLGRWMLLVLACTTRGPRASSRPGSGPMPTASIIWRGCAGLRVSRVRTVAREVAGAWVMVGSCARGVVGVLL